MRVANFFSSAWTSHLEVYLQNNPACFGLQVASAWLPTETLGSFWPETFSYLHLYAWKGIEIDFLENKKKSTIFEL